MSWTTEPTTATLDDLLRCICVEEPSLDKSLQSVVTDKAGCSDVVYLESDEQLRTHLIDMVRNGMHHLTIRLEGRPRSFAEFTKSDTNRIYGSKSCKTIGCPGDGSQQSPEYLATIKDVVSSLNTTIRATGADEPEGTLEQFASEINSNILSIVIGNLFPKLKLQKTTFISGRRGTGPVDFMVVSKEYPSRMLAVNTSGHQSGNSLYKSMVQLDTIYSGQKRKIDEVDLTPSASYGIFSDGTSFSFLECHSEVLNESGFNDLGFSLTVCSSRLRATDGQDELEASVHCIVSHIVWKLMLMMEDPRYMCDQRKVEVNCRKKKGAIDGKK